MWGMFPQKVPSSSGCREISSKKRGVAKTRLPPQTSFRQTPVGYSRTLNINAFLAGRVLAPWCNARENDVGQSRIQQYQKVRFEQGKRPRLHHAENADDHAHNDVSELSARSSGRMPRMTSSRPVPNRLSQAFVSLCSPWSGVTDTTSASSYCSLRGVTWLHTT
jgi:hypothetical protein